MSQLVLSLFPGIGLLDMAFEQEGFCVVRGPDVLWGGDIRRFHPPAGKFDGVIGGPPCQCFSVLVHMVRHNGYEPKFGNLIPEFERCIVEAQPTWFVMENVPKAPTPQPLHYGTWSTLLNNRQCFDENGKPATSNRERRWTFGDRRTGKRNALMIDTAALFNPTWDFAVCGDSRTRPVAMLAGGKPKRGHSRTSSLNRGGKTISYEEACRRQGVSGLQLPGFTMKAARLAVGNGVPLPMGRAIARAVREATKTP